MLLFDDTMLQDQNTVLCKFLMAEKLGKFPSESMDLPIFIL